MKSELTVRTRLQRLTNGSAGRIIKRHAADAGVEGSISGHGLRLGSAVSLAQAGANE